MKNLIILFITLLPLFLNAQNNEGVIVYTETMEMKIELPDDMKHMAGMFPTEQKSKAVLHFSPKESFYKGLKKEELPQPELEGDVDIEINNIIIGGSENSETYLDLERGKKLKSTEFMGKHFLISSDLEKDQWKITGEQKVIAGHNCLQATFEDEEGKVTAWFTPEIPVAVGPADYHGLPGAILAAENKRDGMTLKYQASNVDFKKLNEPIQRPSKGKKVSREQFEKIVEKRMKEMDAMMGGSDTGNGNVKIKIITEDTNN